MGIDGTTGRLSVSLICQPDLVATWQAMHPDPSELIAAIGELLEGNQISLKTLKFLAVGRGPGAFTGVRMAVACAQGLHMGSGVSMIAVSGLMAVAWRSYVAAGEPEVHRVLATLDAKRGQVYWAQYRIESDTCYCLSGENLGGPDEVSISGAEPIFLAGTGTTAVAAVAQFDICGCDPTVIPDGYSVANCALRGWGETLDTGSSKLTPVYLRDSVAVPSSRRSNNGLLR